MRNRIRQFLATSALSLVAVQSGMAADLALKPIYKAPPPVVAPLYNWGGFYVGVHVGGAWARKGWGDTVDDCGAFISGDPFGCATNLGKHTAKGVLGGAQAGFNVQKDRVVFGIEGQFSFSNLRGSHSWASSVLSNDGLSTLTGTQRFSTRVRDLGTIALRLGAVTGEQGNTLWFIKGGGAFADDRFTVTSSGSCSGPCDQFPNSTFASLTAKQFRWGYMVGVGAEHMLARNWSVKIEYNFLGFGKDNVTLTGTDCVAASCSRTFAIDQNIHLVKAGINYHFGEAPISTRY